MSSASRIDLGATRGAPNLGWCLTIGLLLSCWGNHFAASLIQDLPVASALPIAIGALTMTAITLLAAYLPAHRAALVDPIEALRYE